MNTFQRDFSAQDKIRLLAIAPYEAMASALQRSA